MQGYSRYFNIYTTLKTTTMPKETIIPSEVNNKIISMWQQQKYQKSKTAISKELHVCRKKVAQLINMFEQDKGLFDVKKHSNWIVREK